VRSGRWLPCITVLAVTEVCRLHLAHSQAADHSSMLSLFGPRKPGRRTRPATAAPPCTARTQRHGESAPRTPRATWDDLISNGRVLQKRQERAISGKPVQPNVRDPDPRE
jgi:hypothetical protein